MNFDPFGYFSRVIPESAIHRVIRVAMVLLLLCFLLHRVSQYRIFAVKVLWLAETLLFVLLIVAYLFRSPPVDRARGSKEIIIPLIGSAMPFLLLLSPPDARVISDRALLHGLLWLMAAGTCLTAWGIWSLRRSFSITVEARQLVTDGPYRFIRHPVYTGEGIAAAAVTAVRFSWLNLLLLALFLALQIWRSKMEEQKLAAVFPEHASFIGQSRWFWS